MGGRQQAEEQGADVGLVHAEGDGRLGVAEGPDEGRREDVGDDADALRDEERAEDAEAGALLRPVKLLRPQVLPHKGGDGGGEAGDGQEGEALHLGVSAAAAHSQLAEGVDVALHHHVGEADDAVLEAGGQAVAQDEPQHLPVRPDLPEHQPVVLLGPEEPPQAETGAEELGQDSGQGRPVHPHPEDPDEKEVQAHIGNRGDDEVVEGVAAVAHRLHDAHAGVVEGEAQAPGEVDADIGDALGHDLRRGPHPAQDDGRQGGADEGQRPAGDQGEEDGVVDGLAHLLRLPGAEVAGDHHARAHEDAGEEAHKKEDQGPRGGDGGQGPVAQQVPHDEGVRRVVELLEEVPQEEGHREADDLVRNGALCHAYLCRFHCPPPFAAV